MINTIESYERAGFNCGRAHRIQDTGLYKFERLWFKAAAAIESDADKPAIMAAYERGYKRGRGAA